MNSIPASQLVNVVPGVLGAGGNLLALNSVFFTQDPSIPQGTVKSFATLADVQAWFGPSSTEALMAGIYFGGFTNATLSPGLLYFMSYNIADVAAYVRGGSVDGMTLAQLQGQAGTVISVVDGVSSTSLAINLSGATSFSNAAALIQTAVQGGTPSSTATVTYDALRHAFVITSPTAGSPGSTMAFPTGTIVAGLKLTAATGAVLSQGADIATPAGALATLTGITQNWATFMTLWEPVTADKVLWAQANNALGQRYTYVGWDTTVTPSNGADPTGFAVLTATVNGRVAVWGLTGNSGAIAKAAFFCGATAAINFNATNGRITFAFKSQAGLVPDVTNATVASNLLSNGYNFYGAYATANDQFQFLQDGKISGTWIWADAYINQIKLNSDLQVSILRMMTLVNALPYVTRGYDQIRSAVAGPVNSALNFGSIVAGVTLSQVQRVQVNTANGGLDVASTLQSRGWYLQILDADPTVRVVRGSPPCTLWYTDGGSIQKINLASIDVQ